MALVFLVLSIDKVIVRVGARYWPGHVVVFE